MPSKPLPPEDLAHILIHTRDIFPVLANARLFLTGGTGFFGHWLLESLLYANDELSLNLRATVLTRNAAAFRAKSPHITNHPAIMLLEGDVATFSFPTEPHTHIIHAATDSGGQQSAQSPEQLAASILSGTQHVLDFATQCSSPEPPSHQPIRILYTSTGAVYGRSTTLLHTPESYLETHHPQLPAHSYEAAKLQAEQILLNASTLDPEPSRLAPVIARCFAFVGPHLPLDQHFAIGNFLHSALHHQPIHIKGDGTPRRSWLYMADLAIWLWTLLLRAPAGSAYNVGSDEGMTIAEAARLTAATLAPSIPVQIDGTPNPAAPRNSYVPDITRAQRDLNLNVTIPLAEALRRTAAWRKQ